ncbi:MAG: SUMF1/EgtB/PvdO family nonheme iron enzyme, partial [Candidatus Poribacteria bacterium]
MGAPADAIGQPSGVEMALVPAATFLMGTPEARLVTIVEDLGAHSPGRPIRREWFEDETPQHEVSLDAYYMDRFEVTNAQYRLFIDQTAHAEPMFWDDPRLNQPGYPVVGVSWHDAMAYAAWAGKSLPTEAQWERPARGGLTGKTYPWGDRWPPPAGVGNFGGDTPDGYAGAAPVGSFAPNPLGVHDLVGNVAEWCLDAYSETYYASAADRNPLNEAPSDVRVLRVVRGGGWSGTAIQVRCAYRGRDIPTSTYDLVGFRCVVPVGSETPPRRELERRGDPPPDSPPVDRQKPVPEHLDHLEARSGSVFTDVTEEAGIQFQHVAGLSESKHLMETMGAGAAFFDADGDGDMDLYLVNSGYVGTPTIDPQPRNALYRNDGDGAFTDVTDASGTGHAGYGMGTAAADYDGDGDIDLYVTNYGSNALYRNNGDGTFDDVARVAGVGGDRWSVSSAFVDIDNDGDLDLYVVNYVEYELS